MATDNDTFNEEMKRWASASVSEIRMALAGMGARKSGMVIRMLKARTAQQFGLTNRITFSFPRHLVHIEKGSRKGYGGKKGSTWFTQGQRRKTNPRSLGRMGTGASVARPTFNPIIDKRMPLLASIAATYYANMGAKALLIK